MVVSQKRNKNLCPLSTGVGWRNPHFNRVATESLYTSLQQSETSLLHVGVRAPQDAGLPLREPRLTSS